jgi:hypothetical protein
VRHTYVQPHYVPVGRREFDSIEIAINNEFGKSMPFEYGEWWSPCTFVEIALFRETMGDHFYLTLPSDSSVNYYADNTASRLVAKLPERNHEVGQSEIIYPHTWNNVDNRKDKYWVGVLVLLGFGKLFGVAYVKTGYYIDGNAFASSLTH